MAGKRKRKEIIVDRRARNREFGPRPDERAAPLEEFSLCHQRDVLAKETSFASLIDITKDNHETMEYHSPADMGEIPYSFKIESTMRSRQVEECIEEFFIPESFCCYIVHNKETILCFEFGWLGVYPSHFQEGLVFTAFLFEIKAMSCQVGMNV